MAMMDVSSVFIDTNVLVYANTAESPFHQESFGALTKLRDMPVSLWISRQILREYAAVMSRPQLFAQPKSATLISQRMQYFQRHFRLAKDNSNAMEQWLQLFQNIPMGGKQVHDAYIVATMMTTRIDHIYTYNVRDFARFDNHITILTAQEVLQM